jgi:hypothetical protein
MFFESHMLISVAVVNSSVEHVILHVVCELEADLCGDAADYVLKVWGLAEYFTSHTALSDYEYIHQCIKLDQDVELSILQVDHMQRPLARTVGITAFSYPVGFAETQAHHMKCTHTNTHAFWRVFFSFFFYRALAADALDVLQPVGLLY